MSRLTASRGETGGSNYAFKTSLVGAMCQLSLDPEAVHWRIGRRSGRIRYERIRAVRLSYRPSTMQSHRFVTEIWSTDNPKLQIISVSWRSVAEQVRQDAGYSAFVAELHRRLVRNESVAQFSTGLPVVTYWIGVTTFVGVMIAMAILTIRAARREEWGTAAIVGAFGAMFVWQIGLYFRRNRPGRYRPDALPKDLLPRA